MSELSFYTPDDAVRETLLANMPAARAAGLDKAYRIELDSYIGFHERLLRNTPNFSKNLSLLRGGRDVSLPLAVTATPAESSLDRLVFPQDAEKINLYRVDLETGKAVGGLLLPVAVKEPGVDELTNPYGMLSQAEHRVVIQKIFEAQCELGWQPEL